MAEQKPPIEVFKEHLVSLGVKIPPCPICQALQWTFATDLVAAQIFNENEPTAFTIGKSAPMALLVCGKCFYFFPFVWAPIRDKADGDQPK